MILKKVKKVIVMPKNWVVRKFRKTFVRKNLSYEVSYEIKLGNETVDFLKGILRKTYKITQVISKSGVVRKVIVSFATVVLAL
jgi:hypothetical protein